MMDLKKIVAMARSGAGQGTLVTLVRVAGSSYRRPGARLLIAPDGAHAGTISGGCLEAEVLRKAAWKVRGGAVVERYSTLFDDTAEIPYGLGCGGTVDLLLEPMDLPEGRAMVAALTAAIGGDEAMVATWLPAGDEKLARLVMRLDGSVAFASESLGNDELRAMRAGMLADAATRMMTTHGREIFIEKIAAPQRLVVLGAGDDAQPLVAMAAMMGWNVCVADGRAQLARAERFRGAQQVVVAESVAGLRISARDAVVVMTHSYEQDRRLLAEVLPLAPKYLGLLGARHRSSLLLSDAAALCKLGLEECCARVHAPVGLDLGGDGPEAIALAVLAEVQACVNGRENRSHRLTEREVREQIARGGASQYLQAQCALDESA